VNKCKFQDDECDITAQHHSSYPAALSATKPYRASESSVEPHSSAILNEAELCLLRRDAAGVATGLKRYSKYVVCMSTKASS
jgi:hypothetical protein